MASFSRLSKAKKTYLDGAITLDAVDTSVSYGLIPIGAVIPVQEQLVGAYLHPGSGVDNGLQLCDGSIISVGTMSGQNTPNMTNDCFLRGSNVSGAPGGANAKSIPLSSLPPHTHGISVNGGGSHNHPNSANFNATPGHSHAQYVTHTGPISPGRRDYDGDGDGNVLTGTYTNFSSMHHNHPAGSIPDSNAPHGHPISVSSTAGSGSSFDVQPYYCTTRYLIRVL